MKKQNVIQNFIDFFKKPVKKKKRRQVIKDERLFVEQKHACPSCNKHITRQELEQTLFVCPECNHHLRLSAKERIRLTADAGVFEELDAEMESRNPLDFPDYDEKIAKSRNKSGMNEGVVTGVCRIHGNEVVMGIMSFDFMGGSMGSVVGEKIARALRYAMRNSLPAVLFTSSGGARMHEGIFSLMQMAKTSAAIAQMQEEDLPLFIVLTDPTTGGVTASFAMLGNVILSEPGALIGFAGPRVIEGTIRQKLPENFQSAEFQQEKGFVDAIVQRKDMRKQLAFLVKTHVYPTQRRRMK
ncbi:MAG: acetyl-CoA carboxylase, carboxyltransferase subunit beta [Spirochaetia bacterium]